MKKVKILEELKVAFEPYSFFWDEWIINGDCNLASDEITLINIYIKNNFSLNIFDLVEYYKKVDSIKHVIRKLELGYQVFKDFVIVNFLSGILYAARDYGHDRFMLTPIRLLEINEEIKEALLKFRAPTIKQLFVFYKVEDFSRGWVYNRIVEFQITSKNHKGIINLKPTEAMKQDST